MLKPYNYIAFDVETTGVNPYKDDIIQIWIVKFDNNFNIQEKFISNIKPTKPLKQLSHIVEFLTSINLQDLENAPSMYDILPKIKHFFDEENIFIGHNIQFDIKFLQKYLPDFQPKYVVDTFVWSKVFFHWQPSYALEIVADSLWIKIENYHNALDDSIASAKLFEKIVSKIKILTDKYPILYNYLQKTDTIWQHIIEIKTNNNSKNLFIPKKPSLIKQNKKILWTNINLSYPPKTVFNIKNCSLKDIVPAIVGNWKKVLFVFHNKSRVEIVKNILNENYINFTYLKQWIYIDETKEQKILNKSKLEEFELKFIFKLFSHFHENISMFNINDYWESIVYNYIKLWPKKINSNIVLATAHDFFDYIENNWTDEIKDYTVAYFDFSYWMQDLGSVVNKPYDLYNFLYMLDLLHYTYKTENSLYIDTTQKLLNKIMILIGILWISMNKYFTWTSATELEIINLFDSTRFWQIKIIVEKIDNLVNKLPSKTDIEKNIKKWWKNFINILKDYGTVKKVMYQQDRIHYIFFPVKKNIDINVLNDYSKGLNIYFFTSNYWNKQIKLCKQKQEKQTNIITDYKENIDFEKLLYEIEKKLKDQPNIYLLSTKKEFSKALFELIFNWTKTYSEPVDIFVENITWWVWKNIYKAGKSSNKKIIIGWLEFLFHIRDNINIDSLFVLNISWPAEQNILNDLYFYLP